MSGLFQVTLKYTRLELEQVMRVKHSVPNVVIRESADATGIVTFLLSVIGEHGLRVQSDHSAEIVGETVFVRIENGDYLGDWTKRVQSALRRLDDHIRR